jgi:hypothetical protein
MSRSKGGAHGHTRRHQKRETNPSTSSVIPETELQEMIAAAMANLQNPCALDGWAPLREYKVWMTATTKWPSKHVESHEHFWEEEPLSKFIESWQELNNQHRSAAARPQRSAHVDNEAGEATLRGALNIVLPGRIGPKDNTGTTIDDDQELSNNCNETSHMADNWRFRDPSYSSFAIDWPELHGKPQHVPTGTTEVGSGRTRHKQ